MNFLTSIIWARQHNATLGDWARQLLLVEVVAHGSWVLHQPETTDDACPRAHTLGARPDERYGLRGSLTTLSRQYETSAPRQVVEVCDHCSGLNVLLTGLSSLEFARIHHAAAATPVRSLERAYTQWVSAPEREDYRWRMWAALREAQFRLQPEFLLPTYDPYAPDVDILPRTIEGDWARRCVAEAVVAVEQLRRQLLADVARPAVDPKAKTELVAVMPSNDERFDSRPPTAVSRLLAERIPVAWLDVNGIAWAVFELPAGFVTTRGDRLVVLGELPADVYRPALLTLTVSLASRDRLLDLQGAYAAAAAVLTPLTT